MKPISRLLIAISAPLLVAPRLALAEAWDYVSYKKDRTSGEYMVDRGNAGTLELVERDGKAHFRIIAGTLDACHRGDHPATVERGAETTTITMTETISGCQLMRYVIRNDGSGGRKQMQRDGSWVNDRFDHGLTPKK